MAQAIRFGMFGGKYTNAVILDEENPILALPFGTNRDFRHVSRLAIFNRVVDQILDHAPEQSEGTVVTMGIAPT